MPRPKKAAGSLVSQTLSCLLGKICDDSLKTLASEGARKGGRDREKGGRREGRRVRGLKEENNLWWIFSVHTIKIQPQTPEKDFTISLSFTLGGGVRKALPFSLGSEPVFLGMVMARPISATQIYSGSHNQSFLCSPRHTHACKENNIF